MSKRSGVDLVLDLPSTPDTRLRFIQDVSSQVAEVFGLPGLIPREVDSREEPDTSLLTPVLGAWHQLISEPLIQTGYARTPVNDEEDHWLTTSMLFDLRAICRSVREILLSVEMAEELPAEVSRLVQLLRVAIRRSTVLNTGGLRDKNETAAFISNAQLAVETYLRTLEERQQMEANQALESLKDKVTEGSQTLDALRRASGATGDEKMSSFYITLAKAEIANANKFRISTIVFLVLGGLVGVGFLFLPLDFPFPLVNDADRYIRLAQKTIAVAALFGSAAYLAKQAHQHRTQANWASSLAVQLQTFDAYMAAIDDTNVRNELRKSFAARAFGEHPAMKGDSTTADNSTVDAAVGLLAKILPGTKTGA